MDRTKRDRIKIRQAVVCQRLVQNQKIEYYNMGNYVVAGAGKGIGLSIARKLKSGNQVYTLSRHLTPELEALHTEFIRMDVVQNPLDLLDALPESLDGLVYCPGSIVLKPFNRLSTDDFNSDFQQNVLGAVRLIQKLLPALKKSGSGSIVLFSTVAARLGMPFHASIASAKGAVEGLTRIVHSRQCHRAQPDRYAPGCPAAQQPRETRKCCQKASVTKSGRSGRGCCAGRVPAFSGEPMDDRTGDRMGWGNGERKIVRLPVLIRS